ncbi:hypothetical protein [Fibrella forsythiae]|uniref:Glycosyltransferase RgtA/B/C/D-like domain-containing protein n=1 Tax=Fibrella forsythiae TaxID=2817061 RepID=A0ABS3JI91_9BACT|nr:hypothetical protein [Fibrella forsythiae]MBO0949718.1 hypothetical protein [Fibrella forsythiae]
MLTKNRLSAALLLTLTGSLTVSLFVKDRYLWMDEVLSYLLLSDPSLAHTNQAIVSGMDANPPLFINLYWLLGHGISLNPFFLKGVSIGLFAVTVTWFFRYVTRLLDQEVAARRVAGTLPPQTALVNFLAVLMMVSLTYLNYTLSTQVRTYSLYLLLGWSYIVVLHQILLSPENRKWLVAHVLVGIGFMFTHNVALFYIAGSGVFFGLLWLLNWVRARSMRFLPVLGTHLLMAVVWLVVWFPSFSIQTKSGIPHSWIPVPTFHTAFKTVGDLLPSLSAHLESTYPVLIVLRVLVAVALFGWIALPRLRTQGLSALTNPAFALYTLAGFLIGFTLLLGLTVSLLHTSVFLNRYFWPSSLLFIYQLLYTGWWVLGQIRTSNRTKLRERTIRLAPGVKIAALVVFLVFTGVFIIFQNRKIPLFSGEIRHDVEKLKPGQPVLFESAYYFLPIRFYQTHHPAYYLLDWQTALDRRNVLESTTDYKILEGVAENYKLKGLIWPAQFNAHQFARRFYVVDEASRYQIEAFVASGRVKVHQIIPTGVTGHRILDCSF